MNTSQQDPSNQNHVDQGDEYNSSGSESSPYQEGEVLRFVRVRFPGHPHSLPFMIGKKEFGYGQKVLAMSERGLTVGYVNSFPYDMAFKKKMLPIKTIKRAATDEDLNQQLETYKKEKEYEVLCKDLIQKYDLSMNLTHVEFTQFGKKVVFYFTAPQRVDFRDLVKDLVGEIKLRIELRQTSLRDRSAGLGGIGSCGRQLCCSSFLSKYGQVNIKMAKTQDLTLNFNKLNGVCGQLKCCLKYEDEVYQHKSKDLPKINSIVQTQNGDIGKVRKLHTLMEQFELLTIDGVLKRYVKEEFKKSLTDYNFPKKFDHVSNETSTVIGLAEVEKSKTQMTLEENQKLSDDAKKFAEETYSKLFSS